ncbi:MAG: hypothetical protein Tsb0014_10360 [Pleurocapsa sp.]
MSNINKKIIVFVEGISYGHIIRALAIARWLKPLKYEIYLACPKRFHSIFFQEGLKLLDLSTACPQRIYQRLRQGKMMYLTEDLLDYYRQDERLIRAIQPDIIVSEFRFTALAVAKKMSIPTVGITDGTCHPNFKSDRTVPDPFARQSWMPLWLLDWIAQYTVVGDLINKQTVQYLSKSWQEAATIYGVEKLPTFFDYASQGDICLLADHPALINIKPLRPQDLYTGVLFWENPDLLPPEITQLNPLKKTVYICLGTQEALATNFLDTYVGKLLQQNVRVIVSRGRRSLQLTISHPNLLVFDFINERKLLPLVDVMVCPGGAMSTYQALGSGVPLMVLPAHANQHFYAEAIASRKLGYFLRPSRLKIDVLVEHTLDLLTNDTIKANVARFQQQLLTFQPKEQILNKIRLLV